MDLSKFETQIGKTGFVLENTVAEKLKRAGWTVISNKYYVDDATETAREIDLLTYKVSKVQHFHVYTVLMISCKKSQSNAWALLARDCDVGNPNTDWWPLHTWVNEKALQYQLDQPVAAKRYHIEMGALGVTEALALPEVEIFAFQEMDLKTGKPQNQRPIFDSITALMKAQAYELSAIAGRKKTPAVYQFNLLSVVDAELLRLMFLPEGIEATRTNSEHYIARYIVNKKETFARIRFLVPDALPDALADYGRLHAANCKWFSEVCDSFYENILEDTDRTLYLIDEFKEKFQTYLFWTSGHKLGKKISLDGLWLSYDKEECTLKIGIDEDQDVCSVLNEDIGLKSYVARALQLTYRYDGKSLFMNQDEVPF